MRKTCQKGTILITLIVAMLMIGVLGAGIYGLTTTSAFTGFLSTNNNQAYQLAQAGVRYAVDKILQTNSNFPSTDFFMPDNQHKFNITIVNNVITSIGIVNAGTFSEARRQIIYDVARSWSANGSIPLPSPQQAVITSGNDGPSLTPTTGGTNPGSAITVASDGTITLGGGTGATDSYGTILYQGSSSISNCVAGACDFNAGIRTYFEFKINEDNSANSTDVADGFLFMVLSAINNTRDRTGGAVGASSGELMGYAGPGNTVGMTINPGLGLAPPKMAVEFDTYPNAAGDVCTWDSRNDHNYSAGFLNHIALMFWGDNLTGSCNIGGVNYPKASYDDNRHGAGTGTNPVNSSYGDTGYYEGTKSLATSNCKSAPASICNWMEDGETYGFRLEIVRTTAGDTTGLYQIIGWIYRLNLAGSPTGAQLTQFKDVTNAYAGGAAQINRTVTLTATDHTNMRRIYFGFTEATGGGTQQIQISNWSVYFPLSGTICNNSISPASANPGSGGATGQTVGVTAASGCSWAAVSNDAWITVTGGASGTGNGTVTYSVASNSGPARIGTISIAGQTFTVTQNDGCTSSISPGSASPAAAGSSGSTVAVTAGAGCAWTAASNNTTWISVTSGSSGTGNGTVTYSVAANSGPARTGTMTIAGQIFTVTQANGCIYSISPGSASPAAAGSSGSTVAVTAGAGCTWTAGSNNAWITVTGGSGGTGNGTVTYNVAANIGPARTGTITIAGQTFTVTQANGCTYAISPGSASPGAVGVSGSTVTVTAGAGCTWTAVSNNAWITVTGGSSGTGNGTATYNVAANSGPLRTGTITIGGQTFTVNQANGCTYSISPGSASPGATGVTGSTVAVTAGAGCTWTAVSNNAWITVTGGSSGTGNGTVTYNVAANSGPLRTGTMTIGGQTFTVTQNNGCTIAISSANPRTVNNNAHNNFNFTTSMVGSCPWTASDDAAWLTLVNSSDTSGTGSATIHYNTTANGTGIARTAHVTVTITGGSSATFTLIQNP